jgi:predicted ATP-grasp superfamily ATP-dependent carboligase
MKTVESHSVETVRAHAITQVGAVVLGGDYQGLGIVRTLGRRKVPVCVIDDECSIARFSRYTKYSITVGNLRDDEAIVKSLLAVGEQFGLKGWVLFPTRDEIVAAIARNKPVLEEMYRVPTPEWEIVKWMCDKRNTYTLAKSLNIPIPGTWYPSSLKEVDEIPLDPPLAVKPAIKEHFFYATKAKAWRANSRAELRELFERAVSQVGTAEVMVQDLIPGDGRQQFSYCAFYKEGHAIGSMTCRRTRQHPPEFGRASTFVETIDLPQLEMLSTRFLDRIGYYGLVEMEYKLDSRDGQYKLLDANPRTWGYHTLGATAGVDFTSMVFSDQTGVSVQPSRGRPGVNWIRLLTDLPTGIADIFGKRETSWSYLRSVHTADTEAVFSGRDPLPGLAELALLPYLAVKRGF